MRAAHSLIRLAAWGACAALFAACRSHAPAPRAPEPQARAVLRQYVEIAYASYTDSVEGARRLLGAVDAFVAQPSEPRLAEARAAWISARKAYPQTEVFRFYGGPIDAVELLVNTWPIDESYIEGPDGKSGFVGDAAAFPDLDAEHLTALNLKEGETSVSTGFHAVEFLLWGRDTRDDGPGNRPASDFSPETPIGRRRAVYLHVVAELLVRHLSQVAAAWAPGEGGYRARFLARPPLEALGLAIKGMGSLSGAELGGERLTVPYETKDQENEHSCFSDNTRDDLAFDAIGIRNLCTGRYVRSDGTAVAGPGLCGLLKSSDPALGARLERETAAAVEAVRAIPAPFDQAIRGADSAPGRIAVHRAIQAVAAQTESLGRAVTALGAGLPLAASNAP